MGKIARLLEEGAIYHVTSRGNNKVKVFHVGHDYRKYICTITKYIQKFKFKLYAYSLMPNHAHMLMEPKNINDLPKIMNALNLSYAIWHNKRYGCVGHVWQGRYGSRIIKDEADLLNCMAYIEMNPVKGGLVEDPESYKRSSCHERFHKVKGRIIDFHVAYTALGETEQERRRGYYEIMFRTVS